MEDPTGSSSRRKRPRRGRMSLRSHARHRKRKKSAMSVRVHGAFVFFDAGMKTRFVEVFGNVAPLSSEASESGPVNHEFIDVGTTKFVIQVVEWNPSTCTRRSLCNIRETMAEHYTSCQFIAWVLSNAEDQANITPGSDGDTEIQGHDVTGPASLLETLDWNIDDPFNLEMASKVFKSATSRNASFHVQGDNLEVIEEMSGNHLYRARPDRAVRAIADRKRRVEQELRRQRELVQQDVDFARQIMAAEVRARENEITARALADREAAAMQSSEALRDFESEHEAYGPPPLTRMVMNSSPFFPVGTSPAPHVVNQFFGAGLSHAMGEVLLLSTSVRNDGSSSSSSSISTRSSSRGRQRRGGFESLRRRAAKAKGKEEASEEDLEAFIAMKKQEKSDVEPAEPKARTKAEETCNICLDSAVDCVYFPCGHSISCTKCADTQKHVNGNCPNCREKILFVTHLYKN